MKILAAWELEMEYLAISLSYPESEGGKLLLSVQQSVDSDEEC